MSETEDIFVAKAQSSAEKEACFTIRAEVFIDEQNVPAEYERDEYDDAALHFLALHRQSPAGTARVVLKDKGATAKIGRVAVRKTARGTGIGVAIMHVIESDPDLAQVGQFALESQTHAIPFYEKLGYSAYGDEYLDCGIPHRQMKKKKT